MVLGFDNAGLLVAGIFAALVLKPHQLNSLGRNCGRALGMAVGYLSNLREEVENSKHRTDLLNIHNEVKESMSTLNAIHYQVKKGARIFAPEASPSQSMGSTTKETYAKTKEPKKKQDAQQIPVSAALTGKGKDSGRKYASEIMLDAMQEEEIAHQAVNFLNEEKINNVL